MLDHLQDWRLGLGAMEPWLTKDCLTAKAPRGIVAIEQMLMATEGRVGALIAPYSSLASTGVSSFKFVGMLPRLSMTIMMSAPGNQRSGNHVL